MLDPDVRRVLDGASVAHLATVLPDGSPVRPTPEDKSTTEPSAAE